MSRLVLRPGAAVTRRAAGELQVGLSAPRSVVLPDTPEVRDLLTALTVPVVGRRRRLGPPAALAALEDAGLVVDARAVDALRRRLDGAHVDGALARRGPDAVTGLAARAHARVAVTAAPGLDPAPLLAALTAAGLAVGEDPSPDLHVLLAAGPLPRSWTDPLLAAGTPHLVVEGGDGGLRVGPFVQPGVTACLRCRDAHEADADPRRPLVVEQLSTDPRAAVVDPLLLGWALGWAAHDVVEVCEGRRPSTWSASVTLGVEPAPVPLDRHPCCGCAWDELVSA